MYRADDTYPTRSRGAAPPVPRKDPIVHSGAEGRRAGPLSPAQLERFERDGFVVLESFFSPAEVEPFLADLEGYATDDALAGRPEVVTEPDSGAIRSIFGIHRLSPRFDALTRDPRLVDLGAQLLGGEVYIHQSRINCKPAFRGRGFDWHSDFETWHAEDGMPRMRCFSVSVSLTPNHDANGPLMLIPRSHRTFYPTVGETPERYWEESLCWQRVGLPETSDLASAARRGGLSVAHGGPGTVTLFDCNTLHASSDNLSPVPRSNLFFVFNSVENRLERPFGAPSPRPEWVAAREHVEPLARAAVARDARFASA